MNTLVNFERAVPRSTGQFSSRANTLAQESPEISDINAYLGRIYRQIQEHEKAAKAFERAALAASDSSVELDLLGQAAAAHQESGEPVAALGLISRMKSKAAQSGENEIEVLKAERRLTELSSEVEMTLGAMERILDLNPADHDTRFSLAYKYSEQGQDTLALLHYLRVPNAERSAITWNNLGVSFDQLSLPAKSVDAYRKSEELGETLAMSNLANKFIGSGFLSEAQKICDAALKVGDFHKNIGRTVARLKEAPEEEDKKEKDALAAAKRVSEFYKDFGRALAKPDLSDIAPRWQGPDCVLEVSIQGMNLVARGSYERRSLGLIASAMAGTLGALSAGTNNVPQRYQIEYTGTTRGGVIVGKVIRAREGEQPKATTLLTSDDDSPRVLLAVNDDGTKIRVLEKGKSSSPRFYEFAKL